MLKRQIDENAPIKLLLTIEEAAQASGLGRSFMYELVLRRKIASVKIGRYRRVPVTALELFVSQQVEQQGV